VSVPASAELERRLAHYHQIGFGDVLEALAYLRDDGDYVLAGGSLAYGLGNHLSDLDVVIAGDATIDASRVPLEHFVGSLRVDVWKFEQRRIDALFASAEEGLASPAPFGTTFGDVDHENDLKLLHRMAFGVVLDGAPPPRSSPRGHDEIACDLVVREYAERMRTSAFLAQSALQAGRTLAALINARQAAEEALQAAIAARGLPFTGDKWLQLRLTQDAPDLGAAYESVARLPGPDGPETPGFVERAVALCRTLLGVDVSAPAVASGAAWTADDLTVAEVGARRLLLARRHAALWELDGDEAAELAGLVGTNGGPRVWACEDLDPAQAARCFALYERGLIGLRWDRGLPLSELRLAGSSGS